jgi:type II secretory pathway component GspD/PulD (secretin)
MSRAAWPALTVRACVVVGLTWTLAGGSGNVSATDQKQEAPATGQQVVAVPKNNQPANTSAPIKITAVGNKLLIASDDPKALALAHELVRLLTQPQNGQGDYEAIRLKTASATEAAKVLDEAFNGPKRQTAPAQQDGSRGSGEFYGRFGAAGAAPPSNPGPNTIRVVAYPPTNTLLVRASPLDMLRIRQLLKNAIDTKDTASKAVIKTWILKPLQFATATEIAGVIREVYREYTNNNPSPTQVGGFSGFGFPGGRGGSQNGNMDANGNPRGVSLSVGVDDRANRIIVNCSESVYQDIQALVDQLDSGTKSATRTVRVVPLQGIDPLLVQQAIDAIQGRRATPAQSGIGQGGAGRSPFGRGDFTPGLGMPPPGQNGGGPPGGGLP